LENAPLLLDFISGRCDVGNCDPDVRNIGLDSCERESCGRESGRCADGGRESFSPDFFQCDLLAVVNDGRLFSCLNGADFLCCENC